jgi:CheY-like chemotaxis protein
MRVSRVAHRAAQNGIDGQGEFGIPGEPLELLVEHLQALLRCGVRVHVVDADLQIIEAGAIETHDPLRRQQVAVGDQGCNAADHSMFRQGLAAVLASQPDMSLVAEANGREAIEQFHAHRSDITLMDLRVPVMNGLDAMAAIRDDEFPDARIILMVTYTGDVQGAMKLGARAYLLKTQLDKELLGKYPRHPGWEVESFTVEVCWGLPYRAMAPIRRSRNEGTAGAPKEPDARWCSRNQWPRAVFRYGRVLLLCGISV